MTHGATSEDRKAAYDLFGAYWGQANVLGGDYDGHPYVQAFVAHRHAALESAACVADPPLMHRKGKPGLWRIRRAKIASDIRALAQVQAA